MTSDALHLEIRHFPTEQIGKDHEDPKQTPARLGPTAKSRLLWHPPANAKEFDWVSADGFSDSFHGLEGQVPLTTLNATQVCAVDSKDFSEPLLAGSTSFTVATQVASKHPLQLALHGDERRGGATSGSTDL